MTGVAAGDVGEVSGNVSAPVPGSLGTLTLLANGDYSYTANANVSGTDTFTYTITDGDGDTSTTTLTITVGSSTPMVTPETNTVNEAALDTNPLPDGDDLATGSVEGSDPTSPDETVTGTLTFTDPDGVSVSGVAAGNVGEVSGDVGALVAGTFGTLQVNSDGSYTYTLTTTSLDHSSQGTAIDGQTDVFTYTVTDGVGNTNTSTITISIIDDVPSVEVTVANESAVVLATQDAETMGAASDMDASAADFSGVFGVVKDGGADGEQSTVVTYALGFLGGFTEGDASGLTIGLVDIRLYETDGVIFG
ncbi:MAG: Ig-like domain-containing protein, partial [Planctomycetota bacterium]|nr:Ig-like domain-containing protein [Planctomycetota bacterium]